MALDLELWAQLNLIGHVSYQDYLLMSQDEAIACLKALNSVIDKAKKSREDEERRRQTLAALESAEQNARFRGRNG